MSILVIMLKVSWMGFSRGEGRLRFPELAGEEDGVRRAIGRIFGWAWALLLFLAELGWASVLANLMEPT